MKVSLNWIKEYADVTLPVDELVQKIGAQLGAVDEVIDLGKKYQGIVIAKVVSCQKHPNADKLSVCRIDDGGVAANIQRDEDGLVEVVCGAPNVRDGMFVAWLPPGTTVPSTYDKDPLVLEAREIRGVVSNGMLASPRELALSDMHDGILEIDNVQTGQKIDEAVSPDDHVAALSNIAFNDAVKPGDDFAAVFGLGDYIIDIENKMFTHRPDLFGQLGVAREIAGITGQKFTSPKWYLGEKTASEDHDQSKLLIRNELPELVPRFMAQVIEGVVVKQSSVQLQSYLARVGIRPINNIVDITNFVMLLTGQPLHAYDFDKVKALSPGSAAQLVIRFPKPREKIRLLNGKEIEPHAKAIMIATDNALLGIGGVMGGADTEVDETTKNIILECASFDMYSIRRTAMEQGLFTDAVTRFTKGQSPLQNDRVLARATSDIICEGGGIPAGGMYDDSHLDGNVTSRSMIFAPVTITPSFINKRLGLKLETEVIERLLQSVEFKTTNREGDIIIESPFWRTDIEIPEDIVEEVGRLYGYDHLPLELPRRDITPAPLNGYLQLKAHIQSTLSAAGANELLTYSFVHGKLFDKVGQDKQQAFQLANALSPDLQYYRLSLTPSLLEKVHPNIKAGQDEFALFEISKLHMRGQNDPNEPKVPLEDTHVAFIFSAGDKTAANKYGGAAYYQARKYLSMLSLENGVVLVPAIGYDFQDDAWGQQMIAPYEPKRSAILVKEGLAWGVVGEFKKSVHDALKLPEYTAGFEIGVDILNSLKNAYTHVPRFPKVEQDISLKVPSELLYGELYNFIHQQIETLKPANTLAIIDPLDIFQRLDDAHHKQISFHLTIAAYDRTLTAEVVNELLDKAAEATKIKFGAERL